jgi:leucyl aminopeptidase
MKFAIKNTTPIKIVTDCLVIVVFKNGILSEEAEIVNRGCDKAITKLINNNDFTGELGETALIQNMAGCRTPRVLLLGAGDRKELNAKNFIKAMRKALQKIFATKAKNVHFAFSNLELNDRQTPWLTMRISQEAEDLSYVYSATKSKKPILKSLKSVSASIGTGKQIKALETAMQKGKAIGNGINQAKELGNLPGNICTPTYLAEYAQKLWKGKNKVKVKVLTEKQMRRLGMGSLLSVSAGSSEEAKLIIIEYQGGKKDDKPHALVGKGITFDTGGISLKSGGGMDEMKYDMCGASSVIGSMSAIIATNLNLNVVAVIAAAENMPSGRATKPGDIVTSMSGQTIEVLNTDAEGRLVLCDALTYVKRYKPKSVIDIATLTGAAVATFGSTVSALLSNDNSLASELIDSGQKSLDPVWQLPLLDEYQSMISSNFADIANIGGPRAGTITAACFLSRFTENLKWAHLDIAGSAWKSGPEKGATGRPVALLTEYLCNQAAK